MTCKDCIHYALCKFMDGEICNHFKDKSLIIELPCKVGDVVYGNFYRSKSITKGIVISVKSITNKYHPRTIIEVEYEYIDPYYNDGRKSKCSSWAVYEQICGNQSIASLDFDKANELLEKYLIEKQKQS